MKSIQIKKQWIINGFFSLMFILTLGACNDDKGKDMAHLSVLMTDAPGVYNSVMIDVIGVEVTGNGGALYMMNTNNDIYDLLDFTNGLNTLIATGDLEPGTISQIRLILGSNNSVTIDGTVYQLSTPSAEQSGLKIQVHQTLEPGVSYSILLDFDANQSIVAKGNGEYQLKPVIRTIDIAISGSIQGHVTTAGVIAAISVTSDGITFYTSLNNSNGDFLVAGLPAGVYNITVTPPLPLLPVTLTGKTVVVGASTNIGEITF
ncbi:MAG TPA: carbohydrate-binding protein [Prolixibacteraceae bacterium]|nr:carbohydrate-binding protein [Prolixibacteraceae bacterium]